MRSKALTIILTALIIAATLPFDGLFAFAGSDGAALQNPDVQKLPYTGSQLDKSVNQVIFHEGRNGLFFVDKIKYTLQITFYDIDSGCSEVVYTYDMVNSDVSYYDEASHTLYFLGEARDKKDEDTYTYTLHLTSLSLDTLEASSLALEPFDLDASWTKLMSSVGVDPLGRIYAGTNERILYIFAPDGSLIGSKETTEPIDEFFGFDKSNGNFYYTGPYVWHYWGYDHYMISLMAGNIDNSGNITLPEQNLMIFYQDGFYNHKHSAEMINDSYLAALSTFNGDQLCIVDSSKYDVNDYTSQGTSISMIDSSVSTTLLNISNQDAIVGAANTAPSNYSGYLDISSEGTRCCLHGDNNMIVKTSQNRLTEFGLDSYDMIMQADTAYEPYDFAMFGDDCIVLERDGDELYLERIEWRMPDDFTLSAPSELRVGDTDKVSCSVEGPILLTYEYSCSDPAVITVDERGTISAWKKGTATVTATANETGVKKTASVKVTDSALSESAFAYSYTHAEGTATSNIHLPYTDGCYGEITNSYLAVNGTDLVRVEYNNKKIIAETYDRDFNLKNTRSIDCELELFGGFYSGKEAYYLVFGQPNPDEDDSKEVIRVVRYDKAWNRTESCSINGANTYVPFDAGGLDMCEYDGSLYIHTCHSMYSGGDGYHHQANCDFRINESDMTLADSYTDVMNVSEGYVSHSFMQKVCTNGEYLYRADLGDYAPRGIVLTATSLDKTFSEPSAYATIVDVIPEDSNYTGYELSGLELSDTHYIAVGNGATADNYHANIYVSSSGKYNLKNNKTWLTSNTDYYVNVSTPKLVKLNSNQFLLLWEESNSSTGKYITKAVLLGPDGSCASDIYSFPLSLSECEPVLDDEGCVVWYFTNGKAPVFCRINPYKLKETAEEAVNDPLIAEDTKASVEEDPATDPQNGGAESGGPADSQGGGSQSGGSAADQQGDGAQGGSPAADPQGSDIAGDYQEKPPVTDSQDVTEDGTVLPSGDNTEQGSTSDRADQTGADGTALGAGASAEAAEAAIAGMKNDKDLPRAVFSKLQLRSKKQTKTSITLSWKKVSGAESYVIYGNKCGSKTRLKRLTTVNKKDTKSYSKKFTKVLGKKLKKGTYYKFMIIALDKDNNVVSSSKIIHVATKGGKVGNVSKVTTKAKKNKVTLRKGKKFKLAGKQVAASKKLKVKVHRKVTYESTNSKVATVTSKGVIKAKKKGTCYVYAYAQNGVFSKIKVTVK